MKYLKTATRYLIGGLAALTCAGFGYAVVHCARHGQWQGVLDAGCGAVLFGAVTAYVVWDTTEDTSMLTRALRRAVARLTKPMWAELDERDQLKDISSYEPRAYPGVDTDDC